MMHDPKNMCYVDEKDTTTKKHSYKVTIHLLTGLPITHTVRDSYCTKAEVFDAMTRTTFIGVNDDSIAVNMRNVTFIEIEEITNDK